MSRRVLVIGAGVVGLCCAYYLRREGHDVVVLERERRERDGTSFGNAGLIVPSHFVPLAAPGAIEQGIRWMRDPGSPFYVEPRPSAALLRWAYSFWRASSPTRVGRAAPLLLALNLASEREYRELDGALGGGFGLERSGLLMVCASEHGLAEEAVVAVQARSLGLEARVLSRDDLTRLEPDATIEAAGAVHYDSDAHLDPGLLMAALQSWLEEHGVEFGWGHGVDSLVVEDGRLVGVRGTEGVTRADAVVVAAGSWSPSLVRTVGVRLLIQPGKGYSLTVPMGRHRLRTPAILSEARVAVSPLGERLRVGGTMELSGFKPTDSGRRVSGIVRSALRYLPRLDEAELLAAPRWLGLRPCTPDGLPYLGTAAAHRNLVIATGHAMLGMSLGPITGRVVADLVGGREPAIDIAALDPQRHQHTWRPRSRGGVRAVGA